MEQEEMNFLMIFIGVLLVFGMLMLVLNTVGYKKKAKGCCGDGGCDSSSSHGKDSCCCGD